MFKKRRVDFFLQRDSEVTIMIDFYIQDLFQYNGQMYGRLRLHSNKNFSRFVRVTRITNDAIDWISCDAKTEKSAQQYFNKKRKNT